MLLRAKDILSSVSISIILFYAPKDALNCALGAAEITYQ